MKQLITSIVLLLATRAAICQQQTPAFGDVSKEELTLTNCSFDKNAEAMVLFDSGEFRSTTTLPISVLNERHVRIKILKEKGLSVANVHIYYHSFNDDEVVKDIRAQTYNIDGSGNIVVSKLDTTQIFKKAINKRYSELTLLLPEAKVGSVIEYRYSIAGSGNYRWYFQRAIPVKQSVFKVNFPVEFEIGIVPHTMLPFKMDTIKNPGRDVYLYSMENVPALNDEPFMLSQEDYLQRFDTRIISHNPFGFAAGRTYDRTWQDVVMMLMADEDFGEQLKKNVPRTGELDDMLKTIKEPYKRMATIHDYVRSKMDWNGYDNIWASNGVKSAWKAKKGTSGEINLILVNLLQDAGIDAHALLVSTRSNGRINRNLPSSRQFNKVMAYVEMDGKKYVLDATEKITPTRLMPLDVMATDGLLIEKVETNKWGWKVLWDEEEIYSNAILLRADIDKDGLMKGEAVITSSDYGRVLREPRLKQGKKDFIEYYFKDHDATIDSVFFENETDDSLPLVQHVLFNQPVTASGGYNYFTANLFSGMEKNPFTADNRFSDIFFSYKQHVSIIANFSIPEGYAFEELPKNVQMITGDTGIVFTRMASTSDNQLSVKISIDFKKPIYITEEYKEFKDFQKRLFSLLNEQFVYRKK